MVHLTGESSTPGRMGIILVCKLSSGREASDTVRSQEARQQARDASTIRAHGSRDRTASPRLLCSTPPFLQVYLLSRPSFMIQGTGAVWMRCGGACAVLLPLSHDWCLRIILLHYTTNVRRLLGYVHTRRPDARIILVHPCLFSHFASDSSWNILKAGFSNSPHKGDCKGRGVLAPSTSSSRRRRHKGEVEIPALEIVNLVCARYAWYDQYLKSIFIRIIGKKGFRSLEWKPYPNNQST